MLIMSGNIFSIDAIFFEQVLQKIGQV